MAKYEFIYNNYFTIVLCEKIRQKTMIKNYDIIDLISYDPPTWHTDKGL